MITVSREIIILILLALSFAEVEMHKFRDLAFTEEWIPQRAGVIGFRVASIAVNNHLAFVTFSSQSLNHNEPINMYIETYTIEGVHVKKCVVLKGHEEVHLLRLASFADSRLIVAWIDVNTLILQIQIVDTQTCKTSFDEPISVAHMSEQIDYHCVIIPHTTTFDLFMTQPNMCSSDRFGWQHICQLRYSATEGIRLKMEAFVKTSNAFWEFVPVHPYNSSSDLYYVEVRKFSEVPVSISLVSIETSETYRSNSMNIQTFDGLASVTPLDNGIGICAIDYQQHRAQVGCGAFDKELDVISETLVSLEQRVHQLGQDVVAVQRFSNDSMLVLLSSCNRDNCSSYDVQIQQITFTGSYSEPLRFEKSSCHIPWAGLNLERVESGEYCASYICYEGKEDNEDFPNVITRCSMPRLPSSSSTFNDPRLMIFLFQFSLYAVITSYI